MKKKIFSALLAFVLICSLGLVLNLPATAALDPLVVTITSPTEGAQFEVSDTFNVVATVYNSGTENEYGVYTQVSWSPVEDAELVTGDNYAKYLGDISPGSTQDAQWTLHCLGPSHPLTITVTATGGASDSVNVQQLGEPGIQIVIDSPLDVPAPMKVGVGQQFDVTATVTNTGLEPLYSVYSYLDLTNANAQVVSYPSVPSTLDKGESVTLTWTLECTDADEIISNGDTSSDPRDDTVDYSDIVAWAYGYGVSTDGYVDDDDATSVYQKYLLVEITAPEDGWHTNTCREFYVYAQVTNCYTQPIVAGGTATIYWNNGGDVELFTPPQASQSLPAIGVGETVSVPFPWHLHCLAEGDVIIDVVAVVIASDAITHLNWDSITIHQDEPAALEASSSVPTCYGLSNIFVITSDITNTGDEASVNTTATITWSPDEDVELLSPGATQTITSSGQADGTLLGGDTVPVTWEFHCQDPGTVTFTITPAGYGANTGELIDNANPGYTDPIPGTATVHQMPLVVTITTPEGGETYSECQTFSVEAELYNPGGMGDLGPVDATLQWTGPANLWPYENPTKTIEDVNEGDTQHVAWTVHCDGSGDVTFTVMAETDWDWDTEPQYQETYSEPVTVHQEYATDLHVSILSPLWDGYGYSYGYGYTYVATSQEFAVTALVENWGEADSLNTTVTVDIYPDDSASVMSPAMTIDLGTLAGGASETVTWTLHCDGSGYTYIYVDATGTDENSNDQKFTSSSTMVSQYPAAHLEVDITDVVPVGETEPSYTVPVCSEFDVYYTVTNTGEADAWEVEATLSVTPEGSVRPVAGEDSGYTQYIGTLAGHEQDGTYEGVWRLHCKEACESTITITASGNDEYGLTFSQQEEYFAGYTYVYTNTYVEADIAGEVAMYGYCEGEVQTTGGFVDSYITLDDAVVYADGFFDGWVDGMFEGTITGDFDGYLDGYFTGTIDGTTYNGYYSGGVSALVDGYFDGYLYGYYYAYFEGDIDGHFQGDAQGDFTGNLLGTVYTQGYLEGSADLCFQGYANGYLDGHFEGEVDGSVNAWVEGFLDGTYYEGGYTGSFTGYFDGSIEGYYEGSVNGCFTGAFDAYGYYGMYFSGYIYGGTVYVAGEVHASDILVDAYVEGWIHSDSNIYVSGNTYEWIETMNPGAPILEGFIEPDSVTVKQVEVPVDADLSIIKNVDATEPVSIGTEVTFTVTVANTAGPADATGVRVSDLLPAGLGYVSSTVTQGWYDPTSGIWHVGDLNMYAGATLTITATVTNMGEMYNVATIAYADQPDPTTSNNSDMAAVEGTEPPDVTSVDLDTGWNLFSLPLIPNDSTIDVVLADIQENTNPTYGIWTYDASIPDWFSSIPFDSTWAGDITDVVDGPGYWIYMDTADSFDVDGYEVPLPDEGVPHTYNVYEGWNLIGFKSVTPRLAGDYLAAIDGKFTIIYRYVGGVYSIVSPDDSFIPGQGYWIAITAEGIIYP